MKQTTQHSQQQSRRQFSIFVTFSVLVSAATFGQSAWANTGKVIFSFGNVTLERQGAKNTLRRGALVQSGDFLNTGPRGRAHVRMNDGTMISLRPGTRFEIEEYVNNETVPGSRNQAVAPRAPAQKKQSTSAYRLLKGGFRTITGLIAKRNKAAYRVKTPVATIGIRGTDFTAIYCAGDCGSGGVNDGLYVGVDDGGIAVQNDGGFLDIGNDEYAYVSGPDSPPEQTYEMPAAFFVDSGDDGGDEAADDEPSTDDSAENDESESQEEEAGTQEEADSGDSENQEESADAGEQDESGDGEANSESGADGQEENTEVAQEDSGDATGGEPSSNQGESGDSNETSGQEGSGQTADGGSSGQGGSDVSPGAQEQSTTVVETDRRGANEQPPAANDPGSTTFQESRTETAAAGPTNNDDPTGEVAEPEVENVEEEVVVITPTRFIGASTGPISNAPFATVVRLNQTTTVDTDEFGRVTQFVAGHPDPAPDGGLASYNIGTASEPSVTTSNGSTIPVVGIDSVTDLRWGRWSDGIANVTLQDGTTQSLDLTNQSLHWVAGPQSNEAPAIPTTGTASYEVTGFTRPTDNRGNVGILSTNASFIADFGASNIQHSLALSINGEVWQAQDNNGTIVNGRFEGDYDSVTTTLPSSNPEGRYSGFFADQAAGAAMTYGLTAESLSTTGNVTVNGAVVFGNPQVDAQ